MCNMPPSLCFFSPFLLPIKKNIKENVFPLGFVLFFCPWPANADTISF